MSINNDDPIVYPADDDEAYDPLKHGYPHPDNHKAMPGDPLRDSIQLRLY